MRLEVTRTSLPPFEEFCQEIRELWDSHFVTNMGPKHAEFQAALEKMFGCKVTLFVNGHSALEAALAAMDLPAGSEVITTPFTFVSTTHAIVRRGLVPVFCDVKPEDGTMDPDCLERLISPRSSAILPVHVYGNPCDVERIGEIASRHSLKLVYDAAHAFGAMLGDVPLVRFGDASILSFHATKIFSTVEGGAVCYRDAVLSARLNDEKNFGIRDKEHCAAAGGNFKMNELQAAMGLCNLRHFPEAVEQRLSISRLYRELLADSSKLRPFPASPSYFPVLFESPAARDAAYEALETRGFGARKYFWPLTSQADCYRGRLDPGDTPIAADLSSRILCLPLFPDLQEDAVRTICSIISL